MSQTDVLSLRYKWKQLTASLLWHPNDQAHDGWDWVYKVIHRFRSRQFPQQLRCVFLTLLSEYTSILWAPMSRRSLSASTLRSLDTLNLMEVKSSRFNSFSVLHKHTLGAIQQQNTEDEDKNNDDFHNFFHPSSDHKKMCQAPTNNYQPAEQPQCPYQCLI